MTDISDLSACSIFAGLSDEELGRIAAITERRTIPRKSILFFEGEPCETVFLVRQGLVKTYRLDERGDQRMLFLCRSEDMFPFSCLFQHAVYTSFAEMIVDTVVLAFKRKEFQSIVAQTPKLSMNINIELTSQIASLQRQLYLRSAHNSTERFAQFLIYLIENRLAQAKSLTDIELPLNQQEIADLIGTTRETVTRLFNQFKKKGIIDFHHHRITILDMEALMHHKIFPHDNQIIAKIDGVPNASNIYQKDVLK